MKRLKKRYVIIFVLLVVLISVFSIIKLNSKKEGIKEEVVIDVSEKNYRKVYLLDENQYLIPLSINIPKKENLMDEVYTVISDLRDLKVAGFNSIINSEVKINEIELKDGILNIDFSKEFLDYNVLLEEKIIESLTWSLLDFKEINGVTISVEGERVEVMPHNHYKLPTVLDRRIGINKYHDLVRNDNNSENVVVMYNKEINGINYLVPVTRRVIKESTLVASVIGGMKEDIALFSGLKKNELTNEIVNCSVYGEDHLVSVNLSRSALVDDSTINENLYNLFSITMFYNNLDMNVGFYVDEESVSVSGYYNDAFNVLKV